MLQFGVCSFYGFSQQFFCNDARTLKRQAISCGSFLRFEYFRHLFALYIAPGFPWFRVPIFFFAALSQFYFLNIAAVCVCVSACFACVHVIRVEARKTRRRISR